MRKLWLEVLFLTFASLAFGQLDSDAITVTASRPMTAQPDEAVFAVSVTSGLNTGLDQIVGALQGSGITAANLASVNTVTSNNPLQGIGFLQTSLQWTFVFPVPFSKMKDTTASLAMLQQTIGQSNMSLALTFNVQGTEVSAQLRQSLQCSISDLLADATAQAQKLASATGFTAGPVLAMTQRSPDAVPAVLNLPTEVIAAGLPLAEPALLCSDRPLYRWPRARD